MHSGGAENRHKVGKGKKGQKGSTEPPGFGMIVRGNNFRNSQTRRGKRRVSGKRMS